MVRGGGMRGADRMGQGMGRVTAVQRHSGAQGATGRSFGVPTSQRPWETREYTAALWHPLSPATPPPLPRCSLAASAAIRRGCVVCVHVDQHHCRPRGQPQQLAQQPLEGAAGGVLRAAGGGWGCMGRVRGSGQGSAKMPGRGMVYRGTCDAAAAVSPLPLPPSLPIRLLGSRCRLARAWAGR